LLGADDAFAFLDEDDLVGLDVFEGFDEAAGPADFEELDVFRFADAKVHAQIVLRKIAAAATHFVDLRMQALLARKMRDTFDARADAAAIGFRADGFDFDPVVGGAGIATQQLRKIVDGVDDDVEVAVIVEVAEGASARGDRRGNSGASVIGNIFEAPVAQIFVEQLALRITRFSLELLDFGINVTVANEDVGPAVIVHVKKTAAPAEILRVLAETALIGGVLEIRAAEIVVKRRRVAGEIRFDQVEIAVEIVIGGRDAHAGLRLAVGAESATSFDGDVVGDEKIEAAVAIVVDESAAGVPALAVSGDSGFFADVSECAIAVVVIENILSEVGDEEIVETVVVVVAYANTLSPAGMKKSCFGGDVSESPIAIVFEEMIGGFLTGGKIFEAPAVDQKNVQPAVVVVVVERDAAAGGFEKIFVLVLAAENGFGVESGFTRNIEEGNAEIIVGSGGGLCRRCALTECGQPF